jgi:integrase/recombinase XerD
MASGDRIADHQTGHAAFFISGRKACPKGFRHAFAVGSLQPAVPPNLAQCWLGHARISTTAIYSAASGL